ncbi:nicotinate-nucleotide adenylyltransferase [candidate division KSB1 bacterium]|nr:nicotinate-nucleotide adenylyltransferase [candidate division KSB1 bacterium]
MGKETVQKIGVYGGTYDPIHIAHLIIAEIAREQCGLDKVIFIPCAVPPHKEFAGVSAAHHRLKMVELAIADNPYFQASDIEIKRGGTSYTRDTLREISKTLVLKPSQLFLIIGADSLADMDNWKDPDEIFRLSTPVVAGRPGVKPNNKWDVGYLRTPLMEISSTRLRSAVQNNQSIRYFVPSVIEEYIRRYHLYR